MSKKIKESDKKGLDIVVSDREYESNKAKLKQMAKANDEVDVHINYDGNSNITDIQDGEIKEGLQLNIGEVLKDLGILDQIHDHPELRQRAIGIVKNMFRELNAIGLGSSIKTEEEEEFFDPDLMTDPEKHEREMEYGTQWEMEDKMNKLSENKKVPKVELTENIRPRIKKSELIKFLNKNKK